MKFRVEAIYPKSLGTYAPWILSASFQFGVAVYDTFWYAWMCSPNTLSFILFDQQQPMLA
jgi:hypothetical protein